MMLIIHKCQFIFLFILTSFLYPVSLVFSQDVNVKIGVLLPLFRDSDDASRKQLGSEILDGMRFALSRYSKNSAKKLILEVHDTKRDPSLVKNSLLSFSSDNSVIGVIGPIYSSEFSEIIQIPSEVNLPVVSPTATGDNIAQDNYIYQLNPNYEVRGKLMADYLMKVKGFKNFAVIYESSYGVNFQKHFEDQVNRLGGKILFSESYSNDLKNFNELTENLKKLIIDNDLFLNASNLNLVQRQKLEKAGVRPSLIDSSLTMDLNISIYYMFGKEAQKILDSLNIKPVKVSGESKLIQGVFDVLYIPISNPSEIGEIIPMLYSYGIILDIAGTGDWNNEKILSENRGYIKNLIFESEYFPDESSDYFQEVVEEIKKTKYKISKNFFFGYDAMKLIIDLVSEGNVTREQLNSALKNLISYDAIKSKISLDYHGVNSELNILKFDNKIILIERYKVK